MDIKEAVFTVDGITCQNCVQHVTHVLKKLRGVEDVTVELRSGKVKVRYDAGHAAEGGLSSAIEEAGYSIGSAV